MPALAPVSRIHPSQHPASGVRPVVRPEEPYTVEATERILAAIEKLDGKVDGVLQQQAAHCEWRKSVDEDRTHHDTRLDDLEEAMTEQRIGHAKIIAYATGASAAASAIGYMVAKLLGH